MPRTLFKPQELHHLDLAKNMISPKLQGLHHLVIYIISKVTLNHLNPKKRDLDLEKEDNKWK